MYRRQQMFLERIETNFDLTTIKVLDLCRRPGKSTHLLSLISKKVCLVMK
jgi:hypothetical protein